MHGSGAVSCSCSLLIRGPILPAVRQKLHLSPCADSRSRLWEGHCPDELLILLVDFDQLRAHRVPKLTRWWTSVPLITYPPVGKLRPKLTRRWATGSLFLYS